MSHRGQQAHSEIPSTPLLPICLELVQRMSSFCGSSYFPVCQTGIEAQAASEMPLRGAIY